MGSRICKNIGGLRYIGHVVVCFCLMSPLDIRTKQDLKGCLMVMADPTDLGHGKKSKGANFYIKV